MIRLRLTPLLVCLVCLLISHPAAAQEFQPRPEPQPSRLARLASHFCYLRLLGAPSAQECASETEQEAAIRCGEDDSAEPPRRRPDYPDTNPLAVKLAPGELKRHGIGFELSEIFPLGTTCRAPDHHYGFDRGPARDCLMDDRPDGQGVEFSIGCPLRASTRLMLGVQAEEGGRLGRSDLRSLVGFSFRF